MFIILTDVYKLFIFYAFVFCRILKRGKNFVNLLNGIFCLIISVFFLTNFIKVEFTYFNK